MLTDNKAYAIILSMNSEEAVNKLKALNGKITQEKMAQGIGVSVSTVNRWLNDKWKPIKYVVPQIEAFCLHER